MPLPSNGGFALLVGLSLLLGLTLALPNRRALVAGAWLLAGLTVILTGSIWLDPDHRGLFRRPGFAVVAFVMLIALVLWLRSLRPVSPSAILIGVVLGLAVPEMALAILQSNVMTSGTAEPILPEASFVFWSGIVATLVMAGTALARLALPGATATLALTTGTGLLIAEPVLFGRAAPDTYLAYDLTTMLPFALVGVGLMALAQYCRSGIVKRGRG